MKSAQIGFDPETGSLGDIGTETMEVRLATTQDEIEASQRLRYKVFYEEMGARPEGDTAKNQREVDEYDAHCQHLLVINKKGKDLEDKVVGTYRLIRRSAAEKVGGFYSAQEYDISKVVRQPGEILELGRSAVREDFRTRPTMQLLWRGLAAYIYFNKIELLFGCASMPGIDPSAWKAQLSYLYHYHLAPPALRCRALEHRFHEMNLMPQDDIDARAALAELPALIKGYLRVGSYIGDGAVIDDQFNTVDVFIVMQTQNVTDRYFDKYLSPYESNDSNGG